MTHADIQQKPEFTRYQIFVMGLLAFLQFSVILDFYDYVTARCVDYACDGN